MKIKDVAALIRGAVEGDGDVDVTGVSGLEGAKTGDLVFAIDEERLAIAEKTQASCILAGTGARRSTKPMIKVSDPKLVFLLIYNHINKPSAPKAYTDSSATVSPKAKLGENVWIGPGVRIEDDVAIGDNTVIESNSVIQKGSSVGKLCRIHPNVTIYSNVIIKDRVELHSGTVVGADGFGYVRDKEKIYKFPQLGRVIIEDDVEIGANTAIDRGSLSDTVIQAGSKIDNLCQIAHNVKLGRNVIIAGQTGISGSSTVKDNVTLAGQVGVKDNVTIGAGSIIGAQAGVASDISDAQVCWGTPAQPMMHVKRQVVVLNWLTENFPRIKKLLGGKDK